MKINVLLMVRTAVFNKERERKRAILLESLYIKRPTYTTIPLVSLFPFINT
jgi:hypothetical protein